MNQTIGLTRNIIDKYYTDPLVSIKCIEIIKSLNIITPSDLIIEPSAGNGSFIPAIKTLSTNYIFYDLEPEHEEIIKMDFLKTPFPTTNAPSIHIIGNPPFGRQSSLAIKFIKQCCQFANTISFILPKSFKKPSMQKHFPLTYHLLHQSDLSENSFLVNGKPFNVPCIFQVWQLQPVLREGYVKSSATFFEFVKKNDNPDVSFRRVGVNAGKVDKEVQDKSIQSHYFIKFKNGKEIEENIRIMEGIIFEFDNTVGPKSISKQELIKELDGLLGME